MCPQPDLADVHVDQPLTNISVASMNQDSSFIAQKIFPRVAVTKESDKYFVFSKSQLFRSNVEVRGPSAKVKHRNYDLSTGSYQANEYATGILIPDRVAKNSDSPLRPAEDATMIITHDMLMFIENAFSSEFLVTGTWTTNTTLSGTDQWSDYANSDPITNIDDAKQTITGLTGIPGEMLSLAMGSSVWKKLKRHPNILNAFGGGNASLKVATKQMVADLLEVKEVIVSEAVWNTNNEGNATQTLARIVAKNALLYYAPAAPSLMTPSCGYFFTKTVSEILRYRVTDRRSEVVEISSLFDFKAIDVDSGALIINAVA